MSSVLDAVDGDSITSDETAETDVDPGCPKRDLSKRETSLLPAVCTLLKNSVRKSIDLPSPSSASAAAATSPFAKSGLPLPSPPQPAAAATPLKREKSLLSMALKPAIKSPSPSAKSSTSSPSRSSAATTPYGMSPAGGVTPMRGMSPSPSSQALFEMAAAAAKAAIETLDLEALNDELEELEAAFNFPKAKGEKQPGVMKLLTPAHLTAAGRQSGATSPVPIARAPPQPAAVCVGPQAFGSFC